MVIDYASSLQELVLSGCIPNLQHSLLLNLCLLLWIEDPGRKENVYRNFLFTFHNYSMLCYCCISYLQPLFLQKSLQSKSFCLFLEQAGGFKAHSFRKSYILYFLTVSFGAWNYRITKSTAGGWQRSLEIIQSNPIAEVVWSELWPVKFWISLRMQTPQLLWSTSSSCCSATYIVKILFLLHIATHSKYRFMKICSILTIVWYGNLSVEFHFCFYMAYWLNRYSSVVTLICTRQWIQLTLFMLKHYFIQ